MGRRNVTCVWHLSRHTAVFGYHLEDVAGAPYDYATFHLPGDEAPLRAHLALGR